VTALSQLLLSERFSDVTFKFEDGSEIKGHKCILACRSQKFRAMFESGMEESYGIVNISEYGCDAFKIFLKFIYTGFIGIQDLNEDNCMEILELSESYLVQDLKRQCEAFLSKNINFLNLKMLLDVSATYQLKTLKINCFNFTLKNYISIKKENILQELDKETLFEIIDYLTVFRRNVGGGGGFSVGQTY